MLQALRVLRKMLHVIQRRGASEGRSREGASGSMSGLFQRDEPVYGQMTTNTRSCDKCSASALFLVKDLDLAFCGHHKAENANALEPYGIVPMITLAPETNPNNWDFNGDMPTVCQQCDRPTDGNDQCDECQKTLDCGPTLDMDPDALETAVTEIMGDLDIQIEFVQQMTHVMVDAFIRTGAFEPSKNDNWG
jgi:hypothetical protein